MLATDLRNEGVVWAKPFNQGVDREKADYQLFTLIRDKRIWHGGNPDMLEHIQNAGKHQATSEDTKLRIVKKPKGGHIDLVVATSMAAYECLRLML
jgi:phage terminase large subunit-like protein